MEKHEKGLNKDKISEKVLQPDYTDQDEGKDIGCIVEEIKHSCEMSSPVDDTSTQESENMVEEIGDIGRTYNDISKIKNTWLKSEGNIVPQFHITEESDDNCSFNCSGQDKIPVKDVLSTLDLIPSKHFLHNKMYIDAANLSALEKEPAEESKKCIVIHPQLALIINGECMRLVLQGRHIFPDCQINAALMGTKSCIVCTDYFVTYEIPLSFIHSRCRLKASLLKILSLCQLSRELPSIVASKDKVCCVYCAKEVPVKNAVDLKKGQHLTRPLKSLLLRFLRHHFFNNGIVSCSDQTVILKSIHMAKIGGQYTMSETEESYNITSLNYMQYNNLKYSPEEMIDRAESSVHSAKSDNYNLVSNNCETRMSEIMMDSKISLQAIFYCQIIANILMFIFCIPSWSVSGYIRMFTFVAFCIYCIFFIYLTMKLEKYYKEDKIICKAHFIDIRIKIFCQVTFWTLLIFFIFLKCSS